MFLIALQILFISPLLNYRTTSLATYVAQLGDDVMVVEGNAGGTGKDIYKWDFDSNTPLLVGQMSLQKNFGFAVKISSRWFPPHTGKLKKSINLKSKKKK